MWQNGSFWNWYKMVGIIKALKCCQNLYQVVVCPCHGAIYMHMLEIVKKCKISLPAPDQVSGERYRTFGPLVYDTTTMSYITDKINVSMCVVQSYEVM